MPSWKDAASRYDKQQANNRQSAADMEARLEREYAASLEEVAKVDRVVQDFLRAAKSAGNPGVKHDEYEVVGWFVKTRKPKGVGYWCTGVRKMGKENSPIIRTNGTWEYDTFSPGWDTQHDESGFIIGRGLKGLYCTEYASGDIAAAAEFLQRKLVALMRKNNIPIPD